jgi:hypothetical protein
MWVVLLFAGFLVVGLRQGTTRRADAALVAGMTGALVLYVAAWKHLL